MPLSHIQPYLPGVTPHVLVGHVTYAIDSSGIVTVGHRIEDPLTGELIALGCEAPQNAEDANRTAADVLLQLTRLLPTLVDAPPFP